MKPLQGRRILIVEDEMLLALDLETILEEGGAEIVGAAPDVPRALDLLQAAPPDAVTLDMNLNGTSSLPVALELQERGVPFVVVSGYSDAYAKEPALRCAPFVKKPYDIRQLFDALGTVLDKG